MRETKSENPSFNVAKNTLFCCHVEDFPHLFIFLHKARPMAILKSFPNTREGKKWNVNGMNARGKEKYFRGIN